MKHGLQSDETDWADFVFVLGFPICPTPILYMGGGGAGREPGFLEVARSCL